MVRRVSLLFSLLLLMACGGAGGLLDNVLTYPYTKSLTFTFRNGDIDPAHMWLDLEGAQPSNLVAGGATREIVEDRIWVAEDDVIPFLFSVQTEGGALLTLSVNVNGAQARAENFDGFEVLWNGVELSATTTGTSAFPLTKTVAFRLENNSPAPANLTVDPETADPANLVPASGARVLTQVRSWNSPTETQSIVVRVQQEGKPSLSVTKAITGEEASDSSFSGLAARWDGTDVAFRGLGASPFPYVKGLKFVFKNEGISDVNLWAEPDSIGSGNLLTPGTTREAVVKTTWNAEDENLTFQFHAGIDGSSVMDVPMDVNGLEAQAGNFIGFEAVWDGTSLSVKTIG